MNSAMISESLRNSNIQESCCKQIAQDGIGIDRIELENEAPETAVDNVETTHFSQSTDLEMIDEPELDWKNEDESIRQKAAIIRQCEGIKDECHRKKGIEMSRCESSVEQQDAAGTIEKMSDSEEGVGDREALTRAKKNFLQIFRFLKDSTSRVSFVEWLDLRVREAKESGRIHINIDDDSENVIDASKTQDCLNDRQILLNCNDLFKYEPKNSKFSEECSNKEIKEKRYSNPSKDNTSTQFSESETEIIDEKLLIDENEEQEKMPLDVYIMDEMTKNVKSRVADNRSMDCTTCGKRFANISTLKRHSLLHTGIRHHCPGCEKSFSRQDYLKIHQSKCKTYLVKREENRDENAQ